MIPVVPPPNSTMDPSNGAPLLALGSLKVRAAHLVPLEAGNP